MADKVIFRRLGYGIPMNPQCVASYFPYSGLVGWSRRRRCANGMPGHPPCRSPAELEAMLRVRETTKENVQ